jgi:hypothetical protein
VPMPVVSATVVPAPVISVVIPVAPVRSVISVSVAVIRRTVVIRSATVIARSVENRNRNWQTEEKMNTSAGCRLSDECQCRDNHQKDKKLLHNIDIGREYSRIRSKVMNLSNPISGLLQEKEDGAQSADDK